MDAPVWRSCGNILSARGTGLASDEDGRDTATQLVPVLPLKDVCLFPGASLTVLVDQPGAATAVEIATRTGGLLLALARRARDGQVLAGEVDPGQRRSRPVLLLQEVA